jgi:hypothetical protein
MAGVHMHAQMHGLLLCQVFAMDIGATACTVFLASCSPSPLTSWIEASPIDHARVLSDPLRCKPCCLTDTTECFAASVQLHHQGGPHAGLVTT